MQTTLRKMGNSTGLILPRTLLAELGTGLGAAIDLQVRDGALIATPVVTLTRAGWALAADAVASEDAAADWRGFGNEGDAELDW